MFLLIFKETEGGREGRGREWEKERKRERKHRQVASLCAPYLGMCPDRKSDLPPLVYGTTFQPTELASQVDTNFLVFCFFKKYCLYVFLYIYSHMFFKNFDRK